MTEKNLQLYRNNFFMVSFFRISHDTYIMQVFIFTKLKGGKCYVFDVMVEEPLKN